VRQIAGKTSDIQAPLISTLSVEVPIMPLLNYFVCHRTLGIKRHDLVLEIGSGGDPFLRSDILVDQFVDDEVERHTGLIIDRPLVVADGADLPFPSKSVDYVICAHVLEHVPNPAKFLDELSRVGKRGLIITPKGDYDKLHPKGGHIWYVWNVDGTLLLKQKESWNEYPDIREYFHQMVRLPGFWKLFDQSYPFFNTILEWDGTIRYQIHQDKQFDFSKFRKVHTHHEPSEGIVQKPTPSKQKIKARMARFVRPLISAHTNIDVPRIVCCLLCGGKLSLMSHADTYVTCSRCETRFPIRAGLLRLLREEMTH
jgi:SAM-dependent methyltransferase/uncharacterized protein YbaR (Trm112 family)